MHNNNTTTNNNNNGKNNHHHHHHHHHHHYYNNFPPMPQSISPRISFSNDFVESQCGSGGGRGSGVAATALPPKFPSCPEAASSSDFEFSVSNHNMMSADELFFRGRILPSFRGSKMTLREELLVEEDGEEEEEEALARPPTRGSGGSPTVGRWKGLLGLRKVGKKGDSSNKYEGSGDRSFDNNSSSQEMMNHGIVNKFK